jgi:hypothetical protein
MEKTIVICDGCGKTKQEANHWFRLDQRSSTIVSLAKWENGALCAGELHLCGAECANKKISQFLGSK